MTKTKQPEPPPAPEMSPAMQHAMAMREKHMADPEGIAWREKQERENP